MKKLTLITLAAFTMIIAVANVSAQENQQQVEVGLEEQLGKAVPLDATFLDEEGNSVQLGELIEGPTILTLVYFTCPGICTPLLTGVSQILPEMEMKPGKDYKIVTISFDPNDTPEVAAKKKYNYLDTLQDEIPEESWRWLTGDQENIDRITDAVGFRYQPDGKDFNHPGLLTILSSNGMIVRYVKGISFVPADVELALQDARKERVEGTRRGAGRDNLLAFCFVYDPRSNSYVPSVTRIAGLLTLIVAGIFLAVVIFAKRKPSPLKEDA